MLILRLRAPRRFGEIDAALHGGRPGSPDDSPEQGPTRLDVSATRVRRSPGMDIGSIAAVQATPVLLRPRRHDREGRPPHQGGRRRRVPRSSRSPRRSCPTIPTGCGARRRGPTRDVVRAAGSTSASTFPGPACDALGAVAARARVYLAIPVNERDGGTVYNTILLLRPDGALLGKHRKLDADRRRAARCGARATARRCTVFDTPFGRVGGLICWENYMPLARVAMYEQHVDILLAPTWDNSDVWPSSMRHIAKEGRCYVVGITSCLRGTDVPADLPGRDEIYGGRRRLDVARQHRDRRPVRATSSPARSARPRRILYAEIDTQSVRRHAASSTSSATTPAPTSSASASTVLVNVAGSHRCRRVASANCSPCAARRRRARCAGRGLPRLGAARRRAAHG